MRRYSNLWLALFAVIPLLVLISCGGDDKKPTDSTPTDLPTIPAIEVATDVDFHSTDQNATTAQGMVQGQLGMANGMAAMGQAFIGPLANADWQGAGGDCYDWTYGSASCAYKYEACKVSQNYEWSLTFNGTCWGDIPLVNWVAFAGTTNATGTTGSMRMFEENTTTVGFAWEWETATDGNSGTWLFYEGEIADENLSSTLTWVRQTNGEEDVTWVSPGELKWQTHVNAGGDTGWMDYYSWNETTSAWTALWEIAWNADGTGYWVYYDEEGNETSRTDW
jgi:hypothetical protein